MKELIERLEAAKVGSRELDHDVLIALGYSYHMDFGTAWYARPGYTERIYGNGHSQVTTSLDAALALADGVLPGWKMHALQDQDGLYQTDNTATRWFCGVSENRGPGNVMSKAPTPALALCIAILKAKSA